MELSGYLSLFPGASREKPRFMALAEAVLRQAADLIPLVRSMQSAYSFSQAEGIQLDAIAEAAGLKREPGMADEAFRRYLLAKLKLWTWDGTVSVSPAGTNPGLLPVPAGVQTVTE